RIVIWSVGISSGSPAGAWTSVRTLSRSRPLSCHSLQPAGAGVAFRTMAGPGMRLPGPGGPTHHVDFGRSTQEQVPGFIGLMRILHADPIAPAFRPLLRKE